MRAVLCSSSPAIHSISRRVPKRVSSGPNEWPAAPAKLSSCLSVKPASASSGASFQASATPRPSSQLCMVSSRSTRANSSLYSGGFSSERICSSSCASKAQSSGPSLEVRPATRNRSKQSRSAAAARRAAAEGLLSSCARPADNFPSAASFSRCCSSRVTLRTRSVKSPTRRRESSGMRRNSSGNLAAGNEREWMGSTARPVTPNVFILEKGRTPVTSPARTVKTGPSGGPFSRRARSSPSNITNIVSAGASSRMVISPTLRRRSSDCATNHSRSACG